MRFNLWRQEPKTSGAEHAAAVARTADDWGADLARLRGELDSLAVARATLTTEAGRAHLDGQAARVTDLEAQLAALDGRERVINAAITTAEARQADAQRAEAQARLTGQLRAYHSRVAVYLEHTALVREAEAALSAALRDRQKAMDAGPVGVLYDTLVGAGLVPPHISDVAEQHRGTEALRQAAAHHRRLAEDAIVDDTGAVHTPERDALPQLAAAG